MSKSIAMEPKPIELSIENSHSAIRQISYLWGINPSQIPEK